jgi:hypothetical protein
MDLRIFIVIGIVTCSWIVVSYYHFAIQRKLAVGNFFLPDKGKKFKLFAVIAILYFTINGAIDFGWYYFLIIPFVSFFLAFSLTSIFGKHVQILGVVGFVLLVIANVIIQIEVITA